jgi:hypothetical protein
MTATRSPLTNRDDGSTACAAGFDESWIGLSYASAPGFLSTADARKVQFSGLEEHPAMSVSPLQLTVIPAAAALSGRFTIGRFGRLFRLYMNRGVCKFFPQGGIRSGNSTQS